MVLPPVDALSLAGTVVQFIDFICRIVSKGSEYHSSTDGALVEHNELQTVAANLQRLGKSIKSSVAIMPVKKELSVEEASLQSVAEDCARVAQEFIDLIGELQAFKTIWKKDEIEKVSDRLSAAREQLVVNLLVFMNEQSQKDLSKLHSDNERLETKLLQEVQQTSLRVKGEIEALLSQALQKLPDQERGRLLDDWNKKNQKPPSNLSAKLSEREVQETILRAQGEIKPLLSQALQKLPNQEHGRLLDDWSKKNRKPLSNLSAKLSERVEEEVIRSIQVRLLDSFYFTQIDERYHLIKEAHTKTFQWIFEERSTNMPPWTDFPAWLSNGGDQSKIYWVTGKPGSGKSTLMKYLFDNPQTHLSLQRWAASRELVTASYYFWNPGTPLQKSLHGLLSSLLHQLLMACPELLPHVASFRWRSYELGALHLSAWTDMEMLQALHKFIELSAPSKQVGIFIDGLDEFSGNDDTREDLVALLKKVASMTAIKICISSRPWNIFEDAFGNGPKLRLEDLTREDVRIYVHDLLNQNLRFSRLTQQNPLQCRELVSEIVEKAKGVFLWVFLVVRSLLQGLRNEDGIDDLSRRIRLIPADLEAFFKHMLLSVDAFYRPQSSKLFQVVSCTVNTPSLLSLSFIHETDAASVIERLRKSPRYELDQRHNPMKRRLNTLCQGLLEAHLSEARHTPLFEDHRSSFFEYQVHYLHRTVRDFLQTKDVCDMLHAFSGGPYDSCRALCRAYLTQMDALVPESNYANFLYDLETLLMEFVACAVTIEISCQEAPADLFDELEQTFLNCYLRNKAVFSQHSSQYTIDDKLPGLHLLLKTKQHQTSGFVSFLMKSGRLPAAVKLTAATSSTQEGASESEYQYLLRKKALKFRQGPLVRAGGDWQAHTTEQVSAQNEQVWKTESLISPTSPSFDDPTSATEGQTVRVDHHTPVMEVQKSGIDDEMIAMGVQTFGTDDTTSATEPTVSAAHIQQVSMPQETPRRTVELSESEEEQKEAHSIRGERLQSPKLTRRLWIATRRALCCS